MKVKIEKLVFGGRGLARNNNSIIFVEQVIPGEIVDIKLVGKKGGELYATPTKIIEPSVHRRKPECKYYTICGGCNWQYINYSKQVALKNEIFLDCLKRIAKLATIPEVDIVDSKEWNYRIRAQLKIDHITKSIGFYKKRSTIVIKIDYCPLLDDKINSVLKNQDNVFKYIPERIKQLKVIAGKDSEAATFPVINTISKKLVNLQISNSRFTVSGSSFFQGNKFLIERLGLWAYPHIGGSLLADMYGGVGFFSIMLGRKFKKILIVENVEKQIDLAELNFIQNRIDQFTVVKTSVEEFFKKEQYHTDKPDCVIVDPPRPGLTKTVRKGIQALNPRRIVYYSCNPSTQARDVGFFVHSCCYSIKNAALFDLYPNTHHMETVLLLERN